MGASNRKRPCSLAATFGLACFLCSGAAFGAQDARLVYSRTPDARQCPEETTLRDAVAKRLGYDPFVAVSARSMVVEIRGDGASLRARVYLVQSDNLAGGARELSSPLLDCKELAAAVALAISIAIDPGVVDRSPPETEAEPAPAPQETEAAPDDSSTAAPSPDPWGTESTAQSTPASSAVTDFPAKAKPAAAPRASAPVVWAIGAGGVAASGPEPSPVLGMSVVGSVRGNHWALGLAPRLDFASAATEAGVTGEAKMYSYGASLVPCYRRAPFLACYVLETAVLVSSARGVSVPHVNDSLWFAQGARLAYSAEVVPGLGIAIDVDGLWAPDRVGLRLDGNEVYTTPRFLARLGLGVMHEF
jgi:hypothetical protein